MVFEALTAVSARQAGLWTHGSGHSLVRTSEAVESLPGQPCAAWPSSGARRTQKAEKIAARRAAFEHEPERVAAARGVCARGARGTTPPGVLHGARRTAARPQATLSKRNHPGGQHPTALAAHLPPPPFSIPSGPRASIFSFSRHFGFCLCMLPPLSGRAPPPTQEK